MAKKNNKISFADYKNNYSDKVQNETPKKNPVLAWLIGLCFFISLALFLNSHDSAQIKITLFYGGTFTAFGLWFCKLFAESKTIFTKDNLIKFSPFILYFLYILITFFLQPYQLGRLEPLFKFLGASFIFLIVAFEGRGNNLSKIFSAILICATIAGIYGLMQIINNYLLKGFDILYWTSAFDKRIFSTIANPNFFADFCLFSLMLSLVRFATSKKLKYLFLCLLLLVDIFFTESKGSWLSLGVSFVAFAFIFLNFFAENLKYKKQINIFALCALLACCCLVGYFGKQRMQSVNFRIITWRSTIDMIVAKPIIGTGLGSFQLIYPSYKRADIFYMEGLHNAETQHAENYLLELWATLGTLGLGLFLLILFIQIKQTFINLARQDLDISTRKQIFAVFISAFAIYVHNLVDVSLFFVSTIYFLAIFNGALFGLNFEPKTETSDKLEKLKNLLSHKTILTIFYILCGLVFIYLLTFVCSQFSEIAKSKSFRFVLIYWVSFILAIIGTIYTFIQILKGYKNVLSSIILIICSVIMYLSFGLLRSDSYIAMASSLASNNQPLAITYYAKGIKLNPFRPSLSMFKAVAITQRLDMSRKLLTSEGDTKPLNDFERAESAFEEDLMLVPNDALFWYHRGSLYRKMFDYYIKRGEHFLAQTRANQAEVFFKKALLLDPVYEDIYYQLANLAMLRNDFKSAYDWLDLYIKGPVDEVANKEYLDKHRNNEKALYHRNQIAKILQEQNKGI